MEICSNTCIGRGGRELGGKEIKKTKTKKGGGETGKKEEKIKKWETMYGHESESNIIIEDDQ